MSHRSSHLSASHSNCRTSRIVYNTGNPGGVGGQRVAIASTVLTSPLRTVLAPFNAHGSLVSHRSPLSSVFDLFEADERPGDGQPMIGCHMAPFTEDQCLAP